ncbi:MAG TPA: DUF2671 domain-containing protein [Rickettsiales bacterium]|nr:DUF2671 domain-containing protein [Rickettsiales bacterium]
MKPHKEDHILALNLSANSGSGKQPEHVKTPVPSKMMSEIEMLNHPAYIRQSAQLIKQALDEGCDVLQLPNGDIVTTMTKTVVTQYIWKDGRLVEVKAKPKRARKKQLPKWQDRILVAA